MLVVCGMVLAHLFLRSGWGKVLVVLVAIPLSVAKNGLRIFTIAMLGTRVDPGLLDGRFHRNGGILFFLLSLAGLLVLLWLVGWAERKTTTQAGTARECTTATHPHLSSHVDY
jgi:exosortase/archaeosortase family protein